MFKLLRAFSQENETVTVTSLLNRRVTGKIKLPYTLQTDKCVVVITNNGNVKADYVGSVEILSNIDLDKAIVFATTDVMNEIATVSHLLGPKGLLPSVKRGTLARADEISQLVKAYTEEGEVHFKANKGKTKRFPVSIKIGKLDWSDEKLRANLDAVVAYFGKDTQYVHSTTGIGIKL